VYGEAGNDSISLESGGTNSLYGGIGDDTISVKQVVMGKFGHAVRFSGVNTYVGGKGGDRLEGWAGADTYVFNAGDGLDVINDFGAVNYTYTSRNKTYNKIAVSPVADRILFGEGIMLDDVDAYRDGDHLVVRFKNTETDEIVIENWFASQVYRVEFFDFFDGEAFDTNELALL